MQAKKSTTGKNTQQVRQHANRTKPPQVKTVQQTLKPASRGAQVSGAKDKGYSAASSKSSGAEHKRAAKPAPGQPAVQAKNKTAAPGRKSTREGTQAASSPKKKSVATNSKSRKKKRKYTSVRRAANKIIVVCLVFLLWIGYILWLIQTPPVTSTLREADVGIVLGAALWRDQPSPALVERLEEAARLYEEGRVAYFILSGGFGGLASEISEAQGMKNYLMGKGVPQDRLLLEEEAGNTFQNLLYSKRIMVEHEWKSAVIISHNYHLARAYEIARFLDYEDVQLAAVTSKVLSPLYSRAQEFLSMTKWKAEWLLLKLHIWKADNIK